MLIESYNVNHHMSNGIKIALNGLLKDKLMFGYIPFYEYIEINSFHNNQFKQEIYILARDFAIKKNKI